MNVKRHAATWRLETLDAIQRITSSAAERRVDIRSPLRVWPLERNRSSTPVVKLQLTSCDESNIVSSCNNEIINKRAALINLIQP